MTEQANREMLDTVEQLVDRVGVVGVVGALVKVCDLKAEHLRANWQDNASALDFERVGRVLHGCLKRLMKLG